MSEQHDKFVLNYSNFYDLFNRFEKGFKIEKAECNYSNLNESTRKIKDISVHISKIAKLDGKLRSIDQINIVKDNGKWKVLRYYFPDLITY